jgi:hypothetical protein
LLLFFFSFFQDNPKNLTLTNADVRLTKCQLSKWQKQKQKKIKTKMKNKGKTDEEVLFR